MSGAARRIAVVRRLRLATRVRAPMFASGRFARWLPVLMRWRRATDRILAQGIRTSPRAGGRGVVRTLDIVHRHHATSFHATQAQPPGHVVVAPRTLNASTASRVFARAPRSMGATRGVAPPAATTPVAGLPDWRASAARVSPAQTRAQRRHAATPQLVHRATPRTPAVSTRVFAAPSTVLVWRTREVEKTATAPTQAQDSARMPPKSAAAMTPASFAELAVAPAARAALTQALDPALVDRLAEDVIRRIDRRLRIERERRGL